MPAWVTGSVGVAVGYDHALSLSAAGYVTGWGGSSVINTPPAGLRGVVQVAAGYRTSCALRSDGSVVAWGLPGLSDALVPPDRKSTRLNSSHEWISRMPSSA